MQRDEHKNFFLRLYASKLGEKLSGWHVVYVLYSLEKQLRVTCSLDEGSS
jgi:hypothetical protein